MALTTSTLQLLQELFILATGRAANTADMVQIRALVGENGDLTQINALIDLSVGIKAQQLGVVGMVQAIAKNGLGLVLTTEQATGEIQQLLATGIDSWSKLFTWLEAHEGTIGTTLDNRGEAAVYFTDLLATSGKSDLFAGSSVSGAVTTLLQNIGDSAMSLSNAQQGFGQLATNLTADGISSAVVDGYVSGATVFADDNNDGVLSAGEWSTTTDANGNYVLPLNITAGTIIAFGGTDILTNLAFQGVLTAPAGSTVINPITTLVQAMLDSGQSGTVAEATTSIQVALGLPPNIDLLSYDPLAVLADGTATVPAQGTALAVQTVMLQLANVITQVGNAINSAAANGSGTLQSASASVTAALAGAIGGSTGLIDLGNTTTLTAVIQAAAALETTNTGGTQLTATQAGQIATLTAASNTAAAEATTITELAKVAVVTQGSATNAIISGTIAGNNLGDAITDFTGANLDTAIADAETGVVPGPTPIPTPSPTFNVTETSGVLTFGGTATGDIGIAIDNNFATFTRGGVTATTTIPDIDLKTIILTAGQTLALTAEEVALRGTAALSGAGTYKITDAISLAGLTGIVLTSWTGTLAYTSVADTAAHLAVDGAYADTTISVTVTDAASLEQLELIDSFWGTMTITSVTDTEATLSVASAYSSTSIPVTVVDAVSLAQLAAINALWGTVSYMAITDTATNLLANAGNYVTDAVDVTVSSSATLANLAAIDLLTTGTITAQQITDTAAGIAASSRVSANTYVVLTGSTAAASDLVAINIATTVAVDTSAVTSITGSAADVLAVYNAVSGSFSGLGDEAINLTDATVTAAHLLAIDAVTSANVTATTATNIVGSMTDLTSVLESSTIDTAGDVNVSLNGTVSLAGFTTITGLTTGTVSLADEGTLELTANADISAINAGAALGGTLSMSAEGIEVTMTAEQHIGFEAIYANATTETIILTTAGTFTANPNVNKYNFVEGSTFSVGDNFYSVRQIFTETGGASVTSTFTLSSATYLVAWIGIDQTDVVKIVNGTNIAGNTGLNGGVVIDFQSAGGTLVLNSTQNGVVTFANVGTGVQAVSVSAADTFTAAAGIELYAIIGASDITVLEDTDVNGDAGNQTVTVGGLAVTGTYALGNGTDVIVATTGANIAGVNNGGATTAETLQLTGAITMTQAQYQALTTITAAGSTDSITITSGGAITAAASIESYTVSTESSNNITVNASKPGVNITGPTVFATTITIGGNTVTGTYLLSEDTDTIVATTGAHIAGVNNGGATTAETLQLTGAITMTQAQHQAFTTINASGDADSITISQGGAINAAPTIETYFVSSVGSNSLTINSGNRDVNITGATASNFTTTVTIGGNIVTGNYFLNHNSNADEMIATDGANVAGVNGGASIGAEILQLTGSITMTVAQHNDYTYAASHFGIHAGGSNDTVILANAGTITTQKQVETYVLAAGTNSVTTSINGQVINANALVDGQVLTLAGTHTTTVSLGGGDLTSTSSGSITVNATAGSNVITLGAGNDIISGGGGDDVIDLGTGADTVVIGTVATHGIDVVKNFGYDDVIQFHAVGYIGSAGNRTGTLLEALAGVAAFSAGSAVGFSHGGADYIFINIGSGSYDANEDAVIQVELVGLNSYQNSDLDLYSVQGANFIGL